MFDLFTSWWDKRNMIERSLMIMVVIVIGLILIDYYL